MKRSELKVLPEYFDRYILKCDDVSILEAIQSSITEIENLPMDKFVAIGQQVYAPGKWTLHEVFQHIIDTERIFAYRVLCYSRGETQAVLGFDEDLYATGSQANRRELSSILSELRIVHQSSYALYESFSEEMLDKMCFGFKGLYSVASAGFILAGHQRWHLDVIKERYYPLISKI